MCCLQCALLLLVAAFSLQGQAVVNAADYSGAIVRGGVFTVFGAGLAPSVVAAPGLPLPTTLNGVTVTVTDGKVTTQAPLLYVSPSQINAILPSNIREGSCQVLVVTEARVLQFGNITVTSGHFAGFTQGARGFGPAAVQQYDANGQPVLNQMSFPATPGAVMTIWGTGLGPLSAGSDAGAPVAANLRDDVTIYVDGIPAKPLYAGRAPGLPGIDQINFALPAGVRARCFVPIAISTGGEFSTGTTVAISAAGTACNSELGLSASTLAALDAGKTLRIAVLNYRTGNRVQSAESWLADYDAAYLSYFVNGDGAGLPDGAAICGVGRAFDGTYGIGYLIYYFNAEPSPNTLPKLYGTRPDPKPPIPVITGPQGCAWSFSPEYASQGYIYSPVATLGSGVQCTALSYQFGPGLSAHGDLPPDRPATDISVFNVRGDTKSLTASWNVASVPGDSIVLVASSTFLAMAPIVTGLSCQVRPPASSFVFPQPVTASVLRSPLPNLFQNPVVLSLTNTAYRVFASNDPAIDLVVVRTTNSATATAPLQ